MVQSRGQARQSKYWCFTINNFTSTEVLALRALGRGDEASYIIFGREVGESGTRHLQGYVEFKTKKRFSRAKVLLSTRAHLEARKGTADAASVYCKKDEDYEEFGTLSQPQQGRRTDLEEIKALLDAGGRVSDVAEAHFAQFLQYRRGLEAYVEIKRPPSTRPELRVYVLWGSTGVGKSRLAHHLFPDLGHVYDPSLKWFDGYGGEETVLLDDFRGDGIPGHFLLRVLDIYPLRVPIKGGFITWNPRRILITSNEEPPWQFIREQEPLMRRIHGVYKIDSGIDFTDNAILDGWREKLGI